MTLINMSAVELIAAIKNREVTVVEVAQAFIDRILEVNPILNAIHDFDPERIIFNAKLADSKIESGEKLGRLHGLPITLKDAFYAPGFKGSKGSIGFFHRSQINSCSTVVQRMLDEGAIIGSVANFNLYEKV